MFKPRVLRHTLAQTDRERSRSKEAAEREKKIEEARQISDESQQEDGSDQSGLEEEDEYEVEQLNDESLEKQYLKLVEYKNNLYKIEMLIKIEEDPSQAEEFVKLKNNLMQAVAYQEESIKLT